MSHNCSLNRNPFHINKKHLAAVILARGGSKGIPLKNLAKVGEISLVAKSLLVLNQIDLFDSIWVSTDHELIAEEADKCKFIWVIFYQTQLG